MMDWQKKKDDEFKIKEISYQQQLQVKEEEINSRIRDEKQKIQDEQDALQKAYDAGTIKQADYNKKKKELSKASQDITKNETEFHKKQLQEVGNALGELSALVGKNTAAGKGLAIAQALINTYQGATEALSAKSVLPSPFDVAAKVINVATVLATGFEAVQNITSVNVPGGGGGGGSAPNKNSTAGLQGYAEGGLLDGPSHSEGGININAQGGEAIMTRGAVTMFAPLLSAMNQAGGGTAFNKSVTGLARNDNPRTPNNPLTEPPILKTYVVANELTSMSHKQARLKDLSTI